MTLKLTKEAPWRKFGQSLKQNFIENQKHFYEVR